MKKLYKSIIVASSIFLATAFCAIAEAPKNVLFYIGDGMGFEQVRSANMYNGGQLSFETLPFQGEITTYSANSSITDSAAAATALATGVKVDNGVISIAKPGDGSELETLLEKAQLDGKSVGLLTTAYLTHATPASFGAHETSRNNYSQIGDDYLYQTKPNVLYGGGANGLSASESQSAGYTVAETTSEFNALSLSDNLQAALFGSAYMPYKEDYLGSTYPYPTLSEMVDKAIAVLSQNPNGFFLMIEAGRIDHACHSNRIKESVHETLDFSDSVQVGMDWASGRTDTLLLVTADHETGGLSVITDNGVGQYPTVTFSSGSHTGVNVPIYATGKNAELIQGVMDNTDMPYVCTVDLNPSLEPINPDPQDGATDVHLNAILAWTSATGSVSSDVYLDTVTPPTTLVGTTTNTWINPPALDTNTVYFWQVISDATGSVWSFTTTYAPDMASDPSPTNLETNVATNVELTWQSGARADFVEVYFGIDSQNLNLVSSQNVTTYQLNGLDPETTYYWRVDVINTAGTSVGDIWEFTTAPILPPVNFHVISELTTKGSIYSGSYVLTEESDNAYEILEEGVSAANKNGHSVLDHTWEFDIGDSSSAILYVEAHHSGSFDGDDFIISISFNNIDYIPALTITKEQDTHVPQIYSFPSVSGGSVYVRVQDTDHTRKNKMIDYLFIDQLEIVGSSGGIVYQYAATTPSPSDGSENINQPVSLNWHAGDDAVSHNVWLDWDLDKIEPGFEDPSSLVSSEQSSTTYVASGLFSQTTYFWRIDEVRLGGEITIGQIWSFTTIPDLSCVPSSLDVASISLSEVSGARGTKYGSAIVIIQDNCNQVAEGALVTGHFTGSFNDSVNGVTDSNGVVSFQTSTSIKKPTFSFVVDSATLNGLTL